MNKLEEILNKFTPKDKSFLITVLQEVQGVYGYLPVEVLEEVGKYFKVSLSEIYGVVTFYAQFTFTPHGKHTIKTCQGTACHVKNSPMILQAIQDELNIKPGETTPDMKWTLETVACLGTCFLAPVVMIDEQYFGKLTQNRIKTILKSFKDESK
ncbi:MAG: NADH-quinone oxidoreductase subunit NuoE [Candidatus Firestonebacteria bacterium]